MVERTFDGATVDSEQATEADDTPSGVPLMTFTLIDGGADDDQALETEVLAAFTSGRTAAPTGSGVKGSASTLRRILRSGAVSSSGVVDITPVLGMPLVQIDPQLEAPGPDESGAMLRLRPTVDRLDNEFTLVPHAANAHDRAGRGFLRRKR